MKTYKLIIEVSDAALEKMTSVEEALKASDSGLAMMELMTMIAVKRMLEENGSMTVNMDEIVDDKELSLIKRAATNIGLIGIAQDVHAKEKKEQEQKILESNVGSKTSTIYDPNSSYFGTDCTQTSGGEYKLEL